MYKTFSWNLEKSGVNAVGAESAAAGGGMMYELHRKELDSAVRSLDGESRGYAGGAG